MADLSSLERAALLEGAKRIRAAEAQRERGLAKALADYDEAVEQELDDEKLIGPAMVLLLLLSFDPVQTAIRQVMEQVQAAKAISRREAGTDGS